MKKYHINTRAIQSGWQPKNGEPRVLPIYQSTTYKYDSSDTIGKLFDLQQEGFFYSRIANPTVDAVEKKLADMEGGVGALCTSAGQAAALFAILNICKAGDHFVSSSAIYGGTYNLFSVTMKRMGIDVTFVDQNASNEQIQKAFKTNTKALYGETLANPTLKVLDIERFANIAHANNVPLIVDNTFATPILCRPIEHGADIVMHSTSKYLDGHAVSLGGAIVDSGNFNWKNGKFPEFTTPDESYHGVIYTETFGKSAYIIKARTQLMRDLGCTMAPQNAFLLNLGMETLPLRIERHSQNALAVARFLKQHNKISWVNYPNLEDSADYNLTKKYLPLGASGVVSFGVIGGRETAAQFMDRLKLAAIVVHVADARTGVL
ncbi:MAG: aminotransferase class I/II-fold pyridoxal phosphate-dependent enzyme, partial [Clostridiaceae bacterium]|nr:aminotransferase class I/II-fold pyridoxal phosphate-dependent enzyme [Clostridiaceae bacterium]